MLLSMRLLRRPMMWEKYKRQRGHWVETVQTVGTRPLCKLVQTGRVKQLSIKVKMSSQTATVSCPSTTYNTSCPVLMGCELSFAETWLGVWQWRKTGSRGRRSRGVGDQLEVSEWTLPGPSVGEVTDEGVGASCQPPFAWEEKKGREAGGSLLSAARSSPEGKVYIRSMECNCEQLRASWIWREMSLQFDWSFHNKSDTKIKFKSCFQLSRDGAKHKSETSLSSDEEHAGAAADFILNNTCKGHQQPNAVCTNYDVDTRN